MSELCETHFEKSGWTGDFTTDIEGLRSALEDVYTLGFEDLSWEELEKVCSDSNADAATPPPLTALYPDAVVGSPNPDPQCSLPDCEESTCDW